MTVTIVDSGCANVASVAFALERLGHRPRVSDDDATIRGASHVILPGVGTAPTFMGRLQDRQLVTCIRELQQPCLGICLGMQVMFDHSEEGDTDTLGIFEGDVVHLPRLPGLTIPHMGWNRLRFGGDGSKLLEGVAPEAHAYFVHSFYVPERSLTLATTEHGTAITAVAARDNFHGVQFHPERSGPIGARILRNFLSLS